MSEHHHEKHLEVIVHYPAVKKPFEEKHADRKETLSTLKSTAESPLQAVVRREAVRRVRGAAARLPPQYRRVLILRDIEELNLRETADSMGLSVPAVKSRLFRARLRLSAALRSEPGAADWRAA